MYEDFASTFRGEKTIQACLCEDLKVSGYFLLLLSQSNCCNQFKELILHLKIFSSRSCSLDVKTCLCRFVKIMISRLSATSFHLFTKRYAD